MARPSIASTSSDRATIKLLALFVLSALCLLIVFRDGLQRMVTTWFESEEYSYGVLIPVIAAFLVWQRKNDLRDEPLAGSWAGVAIVLLAIALNALAGLAAVFTLQQYAFVLVLAGLVTALGGWRLLRLLAMPLLILLFMVPLPSFFLNELSSQLQLLSSKLGVMFIRAAGVSVYLEGNVIDLGELKLQVAEACSGLRYLFPLMTLGFIMAYFFKAIWWRRAIVFVSSIPITVLLNSMRIGLIGVTVEYWGMTAAEGLLHDFEGWFVFMISTVVLFLEVIVLAKLGAPKRRWREVFGVDWPSATATGNLRSAAVPRSFVLATLLIAASLAIAWASPQRAQVTPSRDNFAEFPLKISAWNGHRQGMEKVYLDALKLDDYVMADYVRDRESPINFYVAWYNSQHAGQSAHSPKSCLPGGGWRILDMRERLITHAFAGDVPLRVNRAIIQSGEQRQLVYYWFQQRHRNLTNEYLVKWYLFWDALTRNRTDGALIRLVSPIKPGESAEEVDRRLSEFTAVVTPMLSRYVPT